MSNRSIRVAVKKNNISSCKSGVNVPCECSQKESDVSIYAKPKRSLPSKDKNSNKASVSSNSLLSRYSSSSHSNKKGQDIINNFTENFYLLEEEFPLELQESEALPSTLLNTFPSIRKIPKAEIVDNSRESVEQHDSIAIASHYSVASTSTHFLECNDPFELTLFLPSHSYLPEVSASDPETEIQTVNLEAFQESYRNKRTGTEDVLVSRSPYRKSAPNTNAINNFKEKGSCIGEKRKSFNGGKEGEKGKVTPQRCTSIPIHKPRKLKFNPKTAAARYVSDNIANNDRLSLDDEEDLIDYSEITATQLSRVSNTRQVPKHVKDKIVQANQELFKQQQRKNK